jgi:hypothetical protein
MKVGGFLLRHQFEKGIDASHGVSPSVKLNRCHGGGIHTALVSADSRRRFRDLPRAFACPHDLRGVR